MIRYEFERPSAKQTLKLEIVSYSKVSQIINIPSFQYDLSDQFLNKISKITETNSFTPFKIREDKNLSFGVLYYATDVFTEYYCFLNKNV